MSGGGSIQSGSPQGSQRGLSRSTSDLTQRQSNAVYDLRPQGNSGAHTGQLVARSRSSPKSSAPKVSPAEELLASVDADVKAAAKMLKNGESREVVLLLQRAYRKADSADAKTCAQTAMLARASVRLQLAGVYSVLARHREAIEEAVSAMLEADAAWKSMLSESEDLSPPASSSSESPVPEAAFRSLLINPPPWLARTAETSVLARCCAASELREIIAVDDAVAVDEANGEATRLLEEAEMLARHFLPQHHPARNASKKALRRQVTGFDTSADSWFSKHPGTLADARLSLSMSQDQLQSWRAAQDSQLPPLSGLQSRQRLPPSREGMSSFGASPPATAGTAATLASSPPPSTPLSVTFHDQEQELSGVPPPEAPPNPPAHHPAAPSSGWTGRCPAGDVYVSSLPKQKLPRLNGSRKKKKVVEDELSEAQQKRAEGAAGGLDQATAALILPPGPPPNAFQDWLGSFEGAAYDIKRDCIRNEEAAQRIKKGLHDKGLSFKTRYLGSLSDTELFEDRTVFCGYGIRATKIGEKLHEKRAKQFESAGGGTESEFAVEKKAVMNELFKFYRVDPGKSEPDLKTLGNLLKQSAPGQDRRNKKHVSQKEQTLSNMKSLFGGTGGLLGKKADEDNSPELCSKLGAGLSDALKRSSTMASLARPPSK